jgi:transcription elongation factor Elf1
MVKEIYCPVCERVRNKKKLLMKADTKARGVIYPYCKLCHSNVKINLNELFEPSAN